MHLRLTAFACTTVSKSLQIPLYAHVATRNACLSTSNFMYTTASMVAATEVADSAATAIAKADAISEQKLYKITLARSTIGMPPDTRRNTEALGLFKRGMVVYRPVCNEIAGMILKIKELVKLELVDEPEQIHKPATKGYTIVRRTKRSQPALVTTEK